jgi:hypothetical protein
MKTQFLGGQGDVNVKFDLVQTEIRKGTVQTNMKTTVTVTLPNGKTLAGVSSCDTRDNFNRHEGRKFAYLNLIRRDNETAQSLALDEYRKGKTKEIETGALVQAARKHYKLCRQDRTTLMKAVCPKFSVNSPERKALREKAQYERLEAKYGEKYKIAAK